MLPNTIIGGAPRAGTTSVFRWLEDHPDVSTSSTKETLFFYDKDQFPFNRRVNCHNSPLASYEGYFSHVDSPTKVVLEASPGYLCSRTALQAVPALASKPKILFILRKPSDRLFSSYTFLMNGRGFIPPGTSFEAFLQLAKSGNLLYDPFKHSRYSKYVSQWIDALGRSRVGVFLFEELRAAPLEFMKEMSAFVDIDSGFWDTYRFNRVNQSPTIRNLSAYKTIGRVNRMASFFPAPLKRVVHRAYLKIDSVLPAATKGETVSERIADESRTTLRALDLEFRGEVEALQRLIGRDLSVWN